jgi:hypothetical protein
VSESLGGKFGCVGLEFERHIARWPSTHIGDDEMQQI